MNRRKAKKRIKKELGLRKWPGNLPPRVVRALVLDFREALEEALDFAILYGESRTRPKHYNRHLEALASGTKLKPKYTVNAASLWRKNDSFMELFVEHNQK